MGCTAVKDVPAASTGCPAVSTSGAPKPGHLIVGMNSAWNNACNLSALRSAGVTMERLEVDWPSVEPQRGQWSWREFDKQFAITAQHGITMLPLLMAIPGWAGGSQYQIGANQSGFANYVAQVVRRYGPRGSFWRANPRIPYHPARSFEIWNEPYLAQFADGGPNPAAYARMFKAAAIAGHKAQPAARFLLAADASAQTASGSLIPWIAPMYRAVPDLNRYFSGIAVHPYSAPHGPLDYTPGDTRFEFRRIEGVRHQFVARGAGKKPFWITELGWSTCPSSPGNCNNEAQQATYLRQAFQKVKTSYRSWVSAMFVYNYRDSASVTNPTDKERWFGLIRRDGSPKPAWQVLRAEGA
ncbi:MAG TPA: hypothetical protein VGF74_15780 [Thermoleophilaceae bacterium]